MPDTQRHYTRLQTREIARLSLRDGRTLDCEIHDFCPKGLNLVPVEASAAMLASGAPLIQGEAVSVEFPIGEGAQKGPFQLHGKLAYGAASGIGLFIDGIPADAYQALVEARYKIIPPDLPVSDLLPEETQAVMHDCVSVFSVFLERAWRDFLALVVERIEERDASPLPLPDHSRYLAGLAELLRRGSELSRRHLASLAERMQRIGQDQPEAPTKPEAATELSVVDEDSFEDWLHISSVANRIEIDIRSAMYQFAQRFGRLLPVTIDKYSDPFGPDSVCATFQETLRELDLNNAMRGLVYKMFGSALAPGYPQLYQQLSQFLLPVPPLAAPRFHPRGTSGAAEGGGKAAPDSVAEQVAKLAEIADKLFSLHPPLSGGEGPTLIPDLAEARAPAPPASVPSAERPTAPADAALRTRTLSQLEHTLWHIAERLPGAPPPSGPSLTLEQLLERDDASPGLTQGASLSERIGSLLERATSAPGLAQPRREALGVATNLFGKALTEHAAQSDLDMLLRRLERPLYECVLQDDEGLPRNDHPLRRLFNLVDRFAVVADDEGRLLEAELRELLPLVVERAVSQNKTDPDSYAKACDTLEKLLKAPQRARRQRVAAYQSNCESQELLRSARVQVAEVLNQRLTESPLPKLLLRLLEAGWQQYLVYVRLRGDQVEWKLALGLLDSLLAHAAAPRQYELLPIEDSLYLLNAIEERLNGVSTDRRQLAALVDELGVFLRRPALTRGTDSVRLPANWFTAGGDAHPAVAGEADALLAQLRLGDWWDFVQDDATLPMQLVWLSQASATCAFVNRSATRKVDLGLAELARQVADGRASRGEDRDLPLLERSEYGIVDSMYQRLMHKATHDPLTDLPNRKGLLQTLETHPFADAGPAARHLAGMIEFDPFRMIYDSCGIEAGDRLARELAAFLRRNIGPRDTLGVLGDGSFGLFLPNTDRKGGQQLAEKLRRGLQGFRFQHGEDRYAIESYIGLADFAPGSVDATEALRRASAACAAAKADGRETIQVYAQDDVMLQSQEALSEWAGRLDSILAGDELFLRCQRVMPLNGETRPSYYEILLGVHNASGAVVSPQAFVQAAERWKRAHDVDLWVIVNTFHWIRSNPAAFAATGGFSINLSALSLANQSVLATLHRELAPGDIPTDKIIFEITETAALFSYSSAQDFIQQIRRYGCKFCIDDFGSGNASYTYLRNLRTDTLKIDGAYVKDMADDPDVYAMVKSMNEIGHSLGMKTVAEYVSTPAILALVKELGVDYAQGYIVQRPVPIDQLITGA